MFFIVGFLIASIVCFKLSLSTTLRQAQGDKFGLITLRQRFDKLSVTAIQGDRV
jgi:hypothetical protein